MRIIGVPCGETLEDVVEAANILLKMSSSTEIKYSPQEKPVENNVAEQNTVPTQA